jgi:hypothetical protein
MRLPPIPKWNPATDDIDTSDLLRHAQDQFRQSQDRERSLLPSDIIFPRTGQIWEAVRDCEVHFFALFKPGLPFGELRWVPGERQPESTAPLPFGTARLSQGEGVRVVFVDEPKPLTVWFQPLRYDELHTSIVPDDVRSAPRYSHYMLSLRTAHTACCSPDEPAYFTEAFRLIEDVA